MNHKQLTCGITKQADSDDSQWELIIEAMASTPDVDRVGDVVLPIAFAETMPRFMKNPVMMFNHTSLWTIGKVLDYEIREEGLWIRGGIAATAQGKDVATLIRSGVVSTMSFMYDDLEADWDEEAKINTVKKVEVYELGPVSIPANTEALIEQAKAKNIKLKSLTLPNEAGGKAERIIHMKEDEVQTVVESAMTPVKGDLDATKKTVDASAARIDEIDKKVGKIAEIETALKDAVADGNKTDGELRTMVEKASTDFTTALTELEGLKAKIAVNKRAALFSGIEPTAFNMKSLVSAEPLVNAKRLAGLPELNGNVRELQRRNDQAFWVDSILLSSVDETERQARMRMTPGERLKRFAPNSYQELQEFAKAMDTATATEGAEWIPTGFSGALAEAVRVELRVASLFEEWQMAKATDTLPVEGADTIAQLVAEAVAVVTAFDSTEETYGTANVAFTAKKARSRIQLSREMDEDSAIRAIPQTQKIAVLGIARAIDRAIINGDDQTTHFDTGHTVASTDFRRAWDGLRYHYQTTLSAHGVNCGTFSADNIRNIRSEMGKYGLYPTDLALLCSVKTYLSKFLRSIGDVQTLKDYGPKATILTGELASLDSMPIIISEFVYDNENAIGIYDGSVTDRSEVIAVNRSAWQVGNYRDLSVEVVPNPIQDVSTVVCFKRLDFKPVYTPTATTGVTVNVGYNVTF